MNFMKMILLLVVISACTIKGSRSLVAVPDNLEDAVDSSDRADENTDRDEYQNPGETLAFFGVKSTSTVIEINPGAGYFTEILAPFLSSEGQYYMAIPRMPPRPPKVMVENERKLQNILLRHQDVQNKAKFIPFEPLDERNKIKYEFADIILAFNSIHNFVAKNTVDESFKIINHELKLGGILGVVQHRIAESKKKLPKSGYMKESEVIAMATQAGFKLIERSEINANPKDHGDHPEGVWTLPPYYRLGEQDRDKYERIGESDRMTLKFEKVKSLPKDPVPPKA